MPFKPHFFNGVPKVNQHILAYIAIALFAAVNGLLLSRGFIYFGFLPFVLVGVLLAIYRFDLFFLLIIFVTPLSVPLRYLADGFDFDIWLPSELLITSLLGLGLLKLLKGETFDWDLIRHPLTITILLSLTWILATTFTSTMFFVSLKFFLVRLWFVFAFYLVAYTLFREQQHVYRYIWLYTIALLVVIAYTLYRHIGFGLFDQQKAHSAMSPFFIDHTSYGAVLAMLLPVFTGFVFMKRLGNQTRMIALGVTAILVVAVVFSYTRAAWVSLLAAFGVWAILLLRVSFSKLVVLGLVASFFIYNQADEFMHTMEKNQQQSSDNLSEHVMSVTNVSTDISNLERLNRWNCAIRMFQEKPMFGWGPGTYIFHYAPFQLPHEKTPISTNEGDKGNAHSEYLGPLAETGLPGMLLMIAIVLLTTITGVRVYGRAKSQEERILSASLLVGLLTYYIHGVLNNFLDTDKASALFWGFTAILVMLDIRQKRVINETGSKQLQPHD